MSYLARVVEEVHGTAPWRRSSWSTTAITSPNRKSRELSDGGHSIPVAGYDPLQARAMDKDDIRRPAPLAPPLAALRAQAGFDIVYVYAGHDLCLTDAPSCRRATTSAPTNTAAAWRTACACSAS